MVDDTNPYDGHTSQWWAYEAGKWKTRCEHMASDVRMAIECLEDIDTDVQAAGSINGDVASALRSLRNAIKSAGFV